MNDRIVGICRFSFLGQGDWIGMRGKDARTPKKVDWQARMLYAPDRMARRMAGFETMFLPSVTAQTDPDFELWIVTSPELPEPWMGRLHVLCAEVPQVRVIVSEERSIHAALSAPLSEVADQEGRPVLQFRIDDDDALSRNYIARLRAHSSRFDDLQEVAISMAGGLILRSYADEELTYWQALQRFGSAGVAARMKSSSQSIFAINHFDLPRHLTSFCENAGLNYVQLRWDEGDSALRAQGNWDSRNVQIDREKFESLIADDFPFLQGQPFTFAKGPPD